MIARADRIPPAAVAHVLLVAALLSTAAGSSLATAQTPDADVPPPRILLDQSPRAIDYQLRRLSDAQLARVERDPEDVRYLPVYYALLTRVGMDVATRDEALLAIEGLEKTSRSGVILAALDRVDDGAAAASLLRILLAQPATDLERNRQRFVDATERADVSPYVRQGAYAALLLAGGDAGTVFDAAGARAGHLEQLLRGLAFLPASTGADAVRTALEGPVAAVVAAPSEDDDLYVTAVGAVAAVRRDAGAFRLLAGELRRPRHPDAVAAAVGGLNQIPPTEWPQAELEPLVRTVIDRVASLSPDARLTSEALDEVALAERLAGGLDDDRSKALHAELRALGVRVVRIEARFEQVAFDLRWFAVEAGKPVQLVFFNPDAMPHNVVIGAPGSLELIGTEGGAMPMPADPVVKPFVPDVPEVLEATHLVTQGETARLGFVAPDEPGEYVFACTFPGHWVRMYGVMLVVENLEAWEARPTVPTDPMTNRPFVSQREP